MARVVALSNEGLSVRDIEEETGFSKSRVNRLQKNARRLGRWRRPMARDVAAVPDCPTVPIPDAGTAGQPASGTYGDGTDPGTSGGAPSLKALARLALARDSKRDASALIPPVPFPPFRHVAARRTVPLSQFPILGQRDSRRAEHTEAGQVAGHRASKPWRAWRLRGTASGTHQYRSLPSLSHHPSQL